MKVYKVKYENGMYIPYIKVLFFFWIGVGEKIEGDGLVPRYSQYIKASEYIRRWHYEKYGTAKFRIEK